MDACRAQGTRLLYASSAATYGGSATFREEPVYEQPLNVTAIRSLLFDTSCAASCERLDAALPASAYFNVTGRASSTRGAWPRWRSTTTTSSWPTARCASSAIRRYGPGQQSRDFVFVDDVVCRQPLVPAAPRPERHLQSRPRPAQPFNDIALAAVNAGAR